jgi:histidine triad (HIT) family protein
MENCLFCRILRGEIPSAKVYEDEFTYAFRDINPMAAVHCLVIPKTHVDSLNGLDGLTDRQLAACLHACREVARLEGVDKSGYRVVSNCGDDACQSVHHLHFHVLGGQKMHEAMA